MTRFQKLTLTAAAATLLPVAVGGVVRATASGDGCPDWPRCFGKFVPPLEYHSLIEYSHRTVAAVSSIVLLWLAVVLLKSYRKVPALLWPGLSAFPLVMVQAYLGKLVVENGLSPTLVTVHLATAMTLGGVLMLLAVNSFYYDRERTRAVVDLDIDPDGLRRRRDGRQFAMATLTAAATFALILLGAYMRARDAALAFPDWPLMNRSLLPDLAANGALIHFTHRIAALVVAVMMTVLAVMVLRDRNRGRAVFNLTVWADVFFLTEVGIGGANVLARIPPWARSLHVIFSTLTWGALVALATVLYHRRRAHLPLEASSDVIGAGDLGLSGRADESADATAAPDSSGPRKAEVGVGADV